MPVGNPAQDPGFAEQQPLRTALGYLAVSGGGLDLPSLRRRDDFIAARSLNSPAHVAKSLPPLALSDQGLTSEDGQRGRHL